MTFGVTRVEVVSDRDGRVFSAWNVKNVIVDFQDDGRTLKVFYEVEE